MTWQPIETVPRNGSLVLLFDEREGVTAGSWLLGDDGELCDEGWVYCRELFRPQDELFNPSHWMPLPAPPASERDMEAGR